MVSGEGNFRVSGEGNFRISGDGTGTLDVQTQTVGILKECY